MAHRRERDNINSKSRNDIFSWCSFNSNEMKTHTYRKNKLLYDSASIRDYEYIRRRSNSKFILIYFNSCETCMKKMVLHSRKQHKSYRFEC